MDYRQHAFNIFDFQILHLQLNTPLFILALLLVLIACLHFLLFRPVLRTLDGRREEMERLASDTESERAKLSSLVEQYKRDLDRVRVEVEQVRQQGHAAAQKAQEQVLEQARQDAGRHLRAALGELDEDMRQARATLGRVAATLAEQTTRRMLSA